MFRYLARKQCSLSLLLLFLFSAASLAAPTPVPKTKKPINTLVPQLVHKDLVGEWTMVWSGSKWDLKLWDNGGYSCKSGGDCVYLGSWMLGSKSELIVTEAIHDNGIATGNWSNWFVVWERDKKEMINKANLKGKAFYVDSETKVSYLQKK